MDDGCSRKNVIYQQLELTVAHYSSLRTAPVKATDAALPFSELLSHYKPASAPLLQLSPSGPAL